MVFHSHALNFNLHHKAYRSNSIFVWKEFLWRSNSLICLGETCWGLTKKPLNLQPSNYYKFGCYTTEPKETQGSKAIPVASCDNLYFLTLSKVEVDLTSGYLLSLAHLEQERQHQYLSHPNGFGRDTTKFFAIDYR